MAADLARLRDAMERAYHAMGQLPVATPREREWVAKQWLDALQIIAKDREEALDGPIGLIHRVLSLCRESVHSPGEHVSAEAEAWLRRHLADLGGTEREEGRA
jgi:hypothetical protein